MLPPKIEDRPDRPSRLPISFSGWSLRFVVAIDGELLRFLMTASPLRRQAIFLILAICDLAEFASRCRLAHPDEDWRGDDKRDISRAFREWRVRRLPAVLLGDLLPHGLIGVLTRAGPVPLSRPTYRLMLDLLAAGGERAKLLIDAPSVSDLKIQIASKLDPALCRPDMLDIRSTETVQGINAITRLARELAGASDEELGHSVSAPPNSWSQWASRWVEKAQRFPTTPVVPEGFTALNSAAAMKVAATRFSNCLASRISGAVVGRRSYIEYGPGEAIIELDALCDDKWLLLNVHGPNNDPVDPETIFEIVMTLRTAGFLVPTRFEESRERRAAARLLGVYDFEESTGDPVLAEMLDEARLLAEADA